MTFRTGSVGWSRTCETVDGTRQRRAVGPLSVVKKAEPSRSDGTADHVENFAWATLVLAVGVSLAIAAVG